MRVLTYFSETAPAKIAWLSRIVVDKKILPLAIHGSTEEEVINKASEFWDAQVEKAAKRGRKPIKHVEETLGRPEPMPSEPDDLDDIC